MRRSFGWLVAAIVCVALVAPAAAAEEAKEAPKLAPAKQRAKELTAKMKEKLSLTGDQEDKVYKINLKAAEAVDEAIAVPGAGRYDRYQSVKALQNQRDNELKGVLTQDQWKKYKQLKDELKDAVSAKAELKKKG
jgi:hypothetical protein